MSARSSDQAKRSLVKGVAFVIGNRFNEKPFLKGFLALITALGTAALGFVPIDDRTWVWYCASIAVIAIASIPPICEGYWEYESAKGDDNIAIRGRVLSGHMASTLTDLADTVGMSRTERSGMVKTLAERITREIVQGYPDTDGVRCAIYRLSKDQNSMDVVTHFGRQDKPRRFVRNQPRGKGAIEWLLNRNDTPEFVRDTKAEPKAHREGDSEFYTTYISVPIKTPKKAYGMLTIDARRSGDLDENDAHLLAVYAAIVAVAMAEADRGAQSKRNR